MLYYIYDLDFDIIILFSQVKLQLIIITLSPRIRSHYLLAYYHNLAEFRIQYHYSLHFPESELSRTNCFPPLSESNNFP